MRVIFFGDIDHAQNGVQFHDQQQRLVGSHRLTFIVIAFSDDAITIGSGPTGVDPGVSQSDFCGFKG